MKPKLGVEPPTKFLLRRLKEEGHEDLVQEYHEHNRAYQRAISLRNRERTINALKFRMESTPPGSDAYERAKKRLAHEETALEKVKAELQTEL